MNGVAQPEYHKALMPIQKNLNKKLPAYKKGNDGADAVGSPVQQVKLAAFDKKLLKEFCTDTPHNRSNGDLTKQVYFSRFGERAFFKRHTKQKYNAAKKRHMSQFIKVRDL